MSDLSETSADQMPMDGDDQGAFSSRIPYLVIQSGCMIAASELLSRIDSKTQSRDEIAQGTVKIANRIYERFVELSQERRKNRRHKVDVAAKVLVDDKEHDCRVWNISHGGAMVSPLLSLHVGVSVGLKIGRNKPIAARVAAIGARQTNLAFLTEAAEPDRLAGIIAKLLEENRATGD